MALWNLVFQVLAIGLALFSGLVMVPLYVHYLPLDVYGAWLASGNLLAWVTLFDPGISTLIQQRSASQLGANDRVALGETLAVGLLATILVGGALAVGGTVIGWQLRRLLGVDAAVMAQGVGQAYFLALGGAILMVLSNAIAGFNQGLQSAVGNGLVATAAWCTSIIVTFVLLKEGYGVIALGYGTAAMGVVRIVGVVGDLLPRWKSLETRLTASTTAIRAFLGLMCETLLARATGAVLNNSESFVLTRVVGPEAAAAFLLFKRPADVGRMLLERPTMAALPPLSRIAGERERGRTAAVTARILRVTIWLNGLFCAGFVALSHDFLRLWVGERFWVGDIAAVIVVLAAAATAGISNIYHLLYALGDIQKSSRSVFVGGTISLAGGILGALMWGPIGFAVVSGFTSFAVIVIRMIPALRVVLFYQNCIPTYGLLRNSAYALVAAFAAGPVAWLNRAESFGQLSLAAFAIGLVYSAVLFCLSVEARQEVVDCCRQVVRPAVKFGA